MTERVPGDRGVVLEAWLTRRGLFRASVQSGVGVGVAALLSACGVSANPTGGGAPAGGAPASGAPTSSAPAAATPASGAPAATTAPGTAATQATRAKLQLPVYQPPVNAPTPDYPGSPDGAVLPGYLNYPKTPFQS